MRGARRVAKESTESKDAGTERERECPGPRRARRCCRRNPGPLGLLSPPVPPQFQCGLALKFENQVGSTPISPSISKLSSPLSHWTSKHRVLHLAHGLFTSNSLQATSKILPVSRVVTDDYDFQAIIQYCPQPSRSSAGDFRAKILPTSSKQLDCCNFPPSGRI
jgi:hypothetical protein